MRVRYRALTKPGVIRDVPGITDTTLRYMMRFAEDVKDFVAWYPAPPTRSRYVRTNVLRNSWVVTPSREGRRLAVYISNNVISIKDGRPYFQWVHGDTQAWFHTLTGWRVLSEHLERPDYRRGLLQVVRNFLKERVI